MYLCCSCVGSSSSRFESVSVHLSWFVPAMGPSSMDGVSLRRVASLVCVCQAAELHVSCKHLAVWHPVWLQFNTSNKSNTLTNGGPLATKDVSASPPRHFWQVQSQSQSKQTVLPGGTVRLYPVLVGPHMSAVTTRTLAQKSAQAKHPQELLAQPSLKCYSHHSCPMRWHNRNTLQLKTARLQHVAQCVDASTTKKHDARLAQKTTWAGTHRTSQQHHSRKRIS